MWLQQLSEPEFENAPGMMRTLDARDRGFCDKGGMGRTHLATANCAGQMPLNGPKGASSASLHRRPPESAPEADRPKSAPHASALGRVCQCISQCDCQCLVRLSGRPCAVTVCFCAFAHGSPGSCQVRSAIKKDRLIHLIHVHNKILNESTGRSLTESSSPTGALASTSRRFGSVLQCNSFKTRVRR